MLLLRGLLLGLSAAASPGAFQAYLLARALRGGWDRTWSAAFAPLISDGPVVLAVLVILTQVPDWLLRGLRLAGGLFLLYLAWGVLRSLRSEPGTADSPPVDSPRQTIWQAALMNALSPGPWIFWSTIAGPTFLQGWRRSPLEGGAFLLGFYTAMVAVLLGLIALFAALGKADARAVRLLHGLSGLLLAGFGVYQLVGGW
jgi:threonine/homoserine/homoserine lactone efflux protein